MGRPRSEVPIGKRFKQLVVLRAKNRPGERSYWLCRCDCGRRVRIAARTLLLGLQRSCGCAKVVHGMWRRPEYSIWHSMRMRCRHHKGYRSRGITVCARWGKSFAAFLEDMGPRPAANMSIDRIDTKRGYSKANCRWATWHQQARNKIVNRRLTLNGETMVITDWARRIGISGPALHARLLRGWPLERALTTPSTPRSERRWGPR